MGRVARPGRDFRRASSRDRNFHRWKLTTAPRSLPREHWCAGDVAPATAPVSLASSSARGLGGAPKLAGLGTAAMGRPRTPNVPGVAGRPGGRPQGRVGASAGGHGARDAPRLAGALGDWGAPRRRGTSPPPAPRGGAPDHTRARSARRRLSAADAGDPTPTERPATPGRAEACNCHTPPATRRTCALRNEAPNIRPTRAEPVTVSLRDKLFRRHY